ncbi:MAG: hypothetical protein ACYCU5_00055 [Actinomycetes bacterium]
MAVDDLQAGEADRRPPRDQGGDGARTLGRVGRRIGGGQRPGAEGLQQPVGGFFDPLYEVGFVVLDGPYGRVEARRFFDVGDRS